MSTLLDAQKQAIKDIAIADAKVSFVVSASALITGAILVKTGHHRAGLLANIAGVAAAWWGAGQVNMAKKIVEKI